MIKTNGYYVGCWVILRQTRIDKSLTGYQLAKILKISQQQVIERKQVLMLKYEYSLGVLERNWLEFFKVLVNHSNEIADIRIQNEFLISSERYFLLLWESKKIIFNWVCGWVKNHSYGDA